MFKKCVLCGRKPVNQSGEFRGLCKQCRKGIVYLKGKK